MNLFPEQLRRIEENANEIKRFEKDDCYIDLAKCQNEIASLSENDYYVEKYKKDESSYWIPIPKWIEEDSKTLKFRNCLDIGMAYGTLALFAQKKSGCDVFGIDFTDTYISKKLLKKYNFNFDVCNIELEDITWNEKFDLIILTEVLEHFNFYPVPTLQKIRNLLSEKGIVYLSTPDAADWGKLDTFASFEEIPMPIVGLPIIDGHVYQYTRDELGTIFAKAGLKVDRISYSPGVIYGHIVYTLSKIQ
jgi:2-polyprenyl-3-methyl-5-hydroxy-6-metoxy-1,4-benzoquinol methylase